MATDNGKEQVRLYTALAGIQPGDLVDVKSFGRAEVIETLPGGMLRVRVADQASFQVSLKACKRVEKTRNFRAATGLNNRPQSIESSARPATGHKPQ